VSDPPNKLTACLSPPIVNWTLPENGPVSTATDYDAQPAAAQNCGEVFTRRWVVDALLDLTCYTTDRDLGALTNEPLSAASGRAFRAAVEGRVNYVRTVLD
jgi:hypothetical protein